MGLVYNGQQQRNEQMKNLNRRPSWELRNMVKALSMHPWSNTVAEDQRLEEAKEELARRSKEGFAVK